ncbi:hypothetical protein DW742_00735 [Butyricicoccus sp. AM28-25]|mgnify:FL=1|jgi:hypothetical protein|nr:hypothetical protein [Butyricicoccus sp. AM28-25]RHT78821.1 hypothetical protein DW742_00735 [Butyricicoccus sp. AM28-25]
MGGYIKRDTAIRAVMAAKWVDGSDGAMAMEIVASPPAADVAPVVHGRWERDADGDWYCTNCDEVVAICESGRERTYRKPYCPNCGAKMDGGAE